MGTPLVCPATRPCRRVVWWRVCMLLWISWFVVCCVGGPLSSMNVARAETSSPHGLCLHRWGYWAATLARLVAASTFVCLCCGLHRWFSLFVFESWLVATLSVCTFDFIHYIPFWATHHDEFPTNPPNKGRKACTHMCLVRNRPAFFSRGANPRGMPGLIAKICAKTSKPPR